MSTSRLLARLPDNVLSGFRGAGTTTTLHHMSTNRDDSRVAITDNDMSEFKINASHACEVLDQDLLTDLELVQRPDFRSSSIDSRLSAEAETKVVMAMEAGS